MHGEECPNCGRLFKDGKELSIHWMEEHPENPRTRSYRCKRCLAEMEFWQIGAHIEEHEKWLITFDWEKDDI